MRFLMTSAVLVLMLAGPVAAADTYTIDAGHSEATFQIRHLVTKVRGNFGEFGGTIRLDRENPAASSATFTIQTASIDTNLEDRDNHLRGADFFDVENHPQITFESTKFEKTGDNTFDVTGTLTMRGVAKTVTLPVTFLGEAADPWGNLRAGFETETTLDRKVYGINWNTALDQGGFILGDDVRVVINLEVIKQKAE